MEIDMSDLKAILAGNVEDVTTAIGALPYNQLVDLRAFEEQDKKRKGVLAAITAALTALEAATDAGTVSDNANTVGDPVASENPEVPPVDTPVVEPLHPAVDGDLRAGTTEVMNRIDFNDPLTGGRQIVEAALAPSAEG